MLDGITSLPTMVLAALIAVFALWTFFLCKLIFLGKPRNVTLKAFGVDITITAPDVCANCEERS